MKDLIDNVIVVTGGSRGIGRSIVTAASGRGAKVVFCARRTGPDTEAVIRETSAGDRVLAIAADVSVEADVERLFDRTTEAFGRVDAVISNAGCLRDDLLIRMSVEDWDRVIQTNLTGSFLVARRAVREFMGQGGGGRIVFVGSISQDGFPGQANYSTSKGGLLGLCRAVAAEFGDQGIRAHLVAPGLTETEMIDGLSDGLRDAAIAACPMRRLGRPDEVASVVLFLAASAASINNGAAVTVSGGLGSYGSPMANRLGRR